jgi:diguanylate cyclase (GGDEF)-like protein
MGLRRRDANTKHDTLARIPLFAGLSRRQVAQLAKMAEELDAPPGKVLCREGRSAREFFVIVEGEAEATKGGESVRRLGPGDVFGEVAVIEHLPRALTLTAVTPLRFVALSSQWFWGVIGGSPEVERRVLRSLILENVTVRGIAEAALRRQAELNEYQATHDALTDLPNRVLFEDRIQQALLAAGRNGRGVAVLLIDLDRFKEVNDTLGHHAGDQLLREVGVRLKRTLRASDTVARLGGDEFGLILPGQNEPAMVVTAIERITKAIEEPIVIQGLPLGIEASIGVAFYPDNSDEVEALLQCADAAMYRAKGDGLTHSFYETSGFRHDPARLTLVSDLRRAIQERELVLHYQPKADLQGGDVTAVEALLRWQHPVRGLVPPGEFIPVAEQTSLVKPLSAYVIDEALRQCRAWDEEGIELSIAVNVSMRNLLDVTFPDEVRRLLDLHHVAPSRLELEITESAVLTDPNRTRRVLERLSSMGLRLSVDDFGTGYSSLTSLKRLPLDEIKIDRSFVMNMLDDEDDAVIVRSTIDLARNLGLDVVAEGVESADVWAELGTLGCNTAQGFFLSRPVPADELAAWLRARGIRAQRSAA